MATKAESVCLERDGLELAIAVGVTLGVTVLLVMALLAAEVTVLARENSEVLPPGSVAVAVAGRVAHR